MLKINNVQTHEPVQRTTPYPKLTHTTLLPTESLKLMQQHFHQINSLTDNKTSVCRGYVFGSKPMASYLHTTHLEKRY